MLAEAKGPAVVSSEMASGMRVLQMVHDIEANMETYEKSVTTIAVAEVVTAEGKTEFWVAAAGKDGYVRPDLRGNMRNTRAPVGQSFKGVNDAERHILRTAQREGARIISIGNTRRAGMCQNCQRAYRRAHQPRRRHQ